MKVRIDNLTEERNTTEGDNRTRGDGEGSKTKSYKNEKNK